MDPNLTQTVALNGLPSFVVLLYMAFSATLWVVIAVYLVRLSAVESSTEKAVLLLTVLANKQGATEEDIRRALGGQEGPRS